MNTIKKLVIGLCGMVFAAGSLFAATATSPEFALSIRHDGIRTSDGAETLRYSTLWSGDASGSVTIAQNGTNVVSGLTGEGVQAWSVARNGTYALTHTTYTNGLVAGVEHASFVVTGQAWLLTGLDIVASTNSVEGGGTVTYQAIATFEDGSTSNVTDAADWSVSPAAYGTISNGVFVTAETTNPSRIATVTASYTHNSGSDVTETASTTTKITFSSRLKRPMSLTINGPDTIDAGATNSYTATVTYNDGTTVEKTLDATWSLTPSGAVATVTKGSTDVKLAAGWTAKGMWELKALYAETCSAVGGLIAWYKLDGDGTDSSVYGNHAANKGTAPTTDHNGVANGACYFNGSTYLEAPDHYALYSVTNKISVCAWMKPSTSSGWQYAFCKSTTHDIRQYGLGIQSSRYCINDGEEPVYAPYGDLGPVWTVTSEPLVANQWQHVMVTYDGSMVKAYRNGELVGSKSVVGHFVDAPGGVLIGYDPPGSDEYFTGALDDIRIYNRALTAEQVQTVYAGGTVADAGLETVTVGGTKTITVNALATPTAPVVKATDGATGDSVSIDWSVPTSARPITAYEIDRALVGTSSWTVLTNSLMTTNYVDTTAVPGEDYIYRVRAANEAGFGGYGSDTGWRSVTLSIDPHSAAFDYTNSTQIVDVEANSAWSITGLVGVASVTTEAEAFDVSVPVNTTLEALNGSLGVVAGLGTDHPAFETFTYTQAARPAVLTNLTIVGGAPSLEGGSSTNFHAIAFFDDGTTRDVTTNATWSISDGAKYGSVSSGLLTTRETTDLDGHLTVSVSYSSDAYSPTTLTASQDVDVTFTMALLAPVDLQIQGADAIKVSESGNYRAFVSWNNCTTTEVTVAESTVWSVTEPYAKVAVGKDAAVVTAYGANKSVELQATYTSGEHTVSGLKSITIEEIVSLPVALDFDVAHISTGSSTNANAWYGQLDVSHDGEDAAQSGKILGAGETWFETTVTNAGTVSFWWKTSCETTYDYMNFTIDGREQARTSGTNGWRQLSFDVTGGTHTFRWTYSKDEKSSAGNDAAWVDQLVWTPLATPSAASGSLQASDGTRTDAIEVTWKAFASTRAITSYELSRRAKGGSWEIVSTSLVTRVVDRTAIPGVEYTYSLRALNDAGWGASITDTGWRAVDLLVDPTEIAFSHVAATSGVSVVCNTDWSLTKDGAVATSLTSDGFVVSASTNTSLNASHSTVTVTAGTDHPTNVVITIDQAGRPARLDVGFVKPDILWRTRMQIASPTNNLGTTYLYNPVSAFTTDQSLEVAFGWTNRSETALVVPAVKFSIYGAETNLLTSWTESDHSSALLASGGSAYSGGWHCEVVKSLTPGNYMLVAELAPEPAYHDVNRANRDNVAYFRFAVRDPSLDAARDVFDSPYWTNLELKVGNDFAQAPHAAAYAKPGIQFGPYVPMDGLIGQLGTEKAPLDLIFLVDSTGSMGGCINGLKNNIKSFFASLTTGDEAITDWRAKVVGYQDVTVGAWNSSWAGGKSNWYWDHEFTTSVDTFNSQVNDLFADWGGDREESLLDAVYRISTETQFRTNSTRVIVAFTDAPYKTPMSYGSAAGGNAVDAGKAAADHQVIVKLISSDNEPTHFHALVDNCYSTNSTFTYTADLASFTGDKAALQSLAKSVSAAVVHQVKVVEPSLTVNTAGKGTISFDWMNDSTAGDSNTFTFVCESVTNLANSAGSGWKHVILELDGGWHTFRWSYGKHGYEGSVTDCGKLKNVLWEPYATTLEITPNPMSVDALGLTVAEGSSNVTFQVECNSTWKVVDKSDWILEDQSTILSGDGDGEMVVHVAPNTAYTQRTGYITVRAGEYGLPTDLILEKTVQVVQKAAEPVPTNLPQIWSLGVKPRWPWSAKVDIDFNLVLPVVGGKTSPVRIYVTGINGEGGAMFDDFPQLKDLSTCAAYTGLYYGFGTNQPFAKQDTKQKLAYVECTTSGPYRITWAMGEDWQTASDKVRDKYKEISSSTSPWGKDGFHTPSFFVRLKASATDYDSMSEVTSDRGVRVDVRVAAMDAKDSTEDPRAAFTGGGGGAVLSGVERIGHPLGTVPPAPYDTRDRSLFPSNGWNSLDFVESLPPEYKNRFDRACVVNNAYVEGGMIESNAVWRADRVHVVRDNVFVTKGASLTIEDGAIVKFCGYTRIYMYEDKSGSVPASMMHNVTVKGAYLTYAYDDTYGGDTLYHNRVSSNFLTQDLIYSQGYTNEVKAWSTGTAISSVKFYSVVLNPVSLAITQNDFVTRYYSVGQDWGALPYPTASNCVFYGWYSKNPKNTTMGNSLNASQYVASKAFMIDTSAYPSDTSSVEVYALLCSPTWYADGSLWPAIDASGGELELERETMTYDGSRYEPLVTRVMVGGTLISSSEYRANYSSGNFTTAGVYSVTVDFLMGTYSNSPSATFTIEPRPLSGAAVLLSQTNALYRPNWDGGVARPSVTSITLPDMGKMPTTDFDAVRMSWLDDATWPWPGVYHVEITVGNGNYVGAVTNVFVIEKNPEYYFTGSRYAKRTAEDAAKAAKAAAKRILYFAGPEPEDAATEYLRALITDDIPFNEWVATNFVIWTENVDADDSHFAAYSAELDVATSPLICVLNPDDLVTPICCSAGYLTQEDLRDFLEASLRSAVSAKAVDVAFGPGKESLAYTGEKLVPSASDLILTYGSVRLSPDQYTVVATNESVDVGVYELRVRMASGVYVGDYVITGETDVVAYQVIPCEVSDGMSPSARARLGVGLDPTNAVFASCVQRPAVTSVVAYASVDYGTNDWFSVGTHTLAVAFSGNYAGTVHEAFEILPQPVSATIVLDRTTETVCAGKTTTELRPSVLSVSDETRSYRLGVDYTLDYGSGDYTTPGTNWITATFCGNYTGTARASFVIESGVAADDDLPDLGSSPTADAIRNAIAAVTWTDASVSRLVTNSVEYAMFRTWQKQVGLDAAKAAPYAYLSARVSELIGDAANLASIEGMAFEITEFELGSGAGTGSSISVVIQLKDGTSPLTFASDLVAAKSSFVRLVRRSDEIANLSLPSSGVKDSEVAVEAVPGDRTKVRLTVEPPSGNKGFVRITLGE